MFQLNYHAPAKCFEEAIPLGNGRLGAMVYGRTDIERISLNEDTFWSGFPKDANRKNGYDSFVRARSLVRKGYYQKAYDELDENFLSDFSESYMPVGTLWIDFGHEVVKNYRRSLDLECGLALVEYEWKNTKFRRQMCVSHAKQVMVLILEAEGPEKLQIKAELDSELTSRHRVSTPMISMEVEAPGHVRPRYGNSGPDDPETICYYREPERSGMTANTVLQVETDGTVYQRGCNTSALYIENASRICVYLAINTSFLRIENCGIVNGKNPYDLNQKQIKDVIHYGWEKSLQEHKKDYSEYFNRSSIQLNDDLQNTYDMDQLLEGNDGTKLDYRLTKILYQFGRYLIIASSRPGTEATNLQGIWNEDIRPIWSSNYTTNINVEMNYWPVYTSHLAEMAEPFLSFIKELTWNGKQTAWENYHARGAVLHHNTDLWRCTHPVGRGKVNAPTSCYWNMAGGWFCHHIWDHYLFTRDKEFLKEFIPVMEDYLRFYIDIMIEKDGEYILSPSTSPENRFYYIDSNGEKKNTAVSSQSTMSYGILREAMKNYLKAINLLNETGKKELEKEVQKIVNKLPAYQIGSKGQLLEWEEEFEEVQPNHRHISHLYSLYPGSDINWRDEILSQAVQRSMEMRGDEGTGWSLAWKTVIWAHLGKGDKAAKLLARFMKVSLERDPNKSNEGGGGICPNLLCTCPPMQIDGNFGITAAITEMLIQSEEEEIRLLPALPDDWKEGRVTGIGTRCQCFVDFSWKAVGEGKKYIKLAVYSSVPQRIRLWIGNQKEALDLVEGRNNHEFWL